MPRRLPPFWRWFSIGLRAVHMAAVVLLGAAIMGAPSRIPLSVTGSVLLASGIAKLALELWKSPEHLREFAGAGMLAKLTLVAWMLVDPLHAESVFWTVVLWSVVFAHAPATFRHRRVRWPWRD
jgi:hypothetical protein